MKTENKFPANNRILIVQPVLAHYRNSLFNLLSASKEFDISIIAGKQLNNIKEINTGSPRILSTLKNRILKVGNHNFIWQSGVIKYIRKNKPAIIVLTGVDPHLLSSLFIAFFNRILFRTKIIWWGHGTTSTGEKTGKNFRKFFFNCGQGIITYSDAGKLNLQTIIDPKIPIAIVRNCINNNEYGFNHSLNHTSQNKELTILFSGRITDKKRLDILIDSLAILKKKGFPFRCIIIGDGPLKETVKKQAETNQFESLVSFLGELYGMEIITYFEAADLFVLPGKVGLSIIHALSFGLPVLTSDKPGIHSPEIEILKPGCNGDFFSGFEPNSLAEKIIEWDKKINTNKNEIAQKCIASVKEGGYTPGLMAAKMMDFFREINAA